LQVEIIHCRLGTRSDTEQMETLAYKEARDLGDLLFLTQGSLNAQSTILCIRSSPFLVDFYFILKCFILISQTRNIYHVFIQ